MSEENTEQEAVSFEDQLMQNLENDGIEDGPVPNETEATEPVPDEAQEVVDLLEAPEFFSKEHREYFGKLQELEGGRDYAQHWLDQYQDNQKYITQKSMKLAEERRQYEQQLTEYQHYQQALQPINQIWQSQGIAPAVGVAQMAHYGQLLHTDPKALINEVAKFANIDLNQLLEEQPFVDPVVDQKLRTLEQQNQQMQQYIGQNQQAQTHQQQQAIQSAISQFTEAQDAEGNFTNPHIRQDSPHFQKVEQEMAYLMKSPTHGISQITDPQQKLEAAYQKAIQYVPEIQAEIQAASEKAAAEKRQAEADKAKQASITTSSKTKEAPAIKKSFDDALRANLGIV